MSIALYADEQVSSAIIRGLRNRGIDIIAVVEDGLQGVSDPQVMDRATALG